MLTDVISESYEDLKREVEDRSWWKKGVINLPSKADKKPSYRKGYAREQYVYEGP